MNFIEKIFGKWIRKNTYKCCFRTDNIIIKNYKLNSIHDISFNTKLYFNKKINELELDFYMDTGKDIYLLRLKDSTENKIVFLNKCNENNTLVTYIIVMKKIPENIDEKIKEELENIVRKLNEIKFPKYYEEKEFKIEEWNDK
jgi:hypothetical protein